MIFVRFQQRLFGVILWAAVMAVVTPSGSRSSAGSAPQADPASSRARFHTQLRVHGPAPAIYYPDVPYSVTLVSYKSANRDLAAWLAQPSDGKTRHPALLYAHRGFALSLTDWEDVRPFVEAGYIVLMPAWRGENGNPGEFERYCGEVEDARSALAYLKAVPGVDPKRVFAAGDTMGGTNIFLLSETNVGLRGAAVCSAFPDISEAIRHGLRPQRILFPYDWNDDRENSARSPGRHIGNLCCPITLYNSDSDPLYVRQSKALPMEAKRLGKSLKTQVFPNTDQRTVVALAVRAMIQEFNKAL